MKREGRQHGLVRSYPILPSPLNPRPESRFVTRFDSPPTAGLFTRVSSKPTNHSKYTGRCGRVGCVDCHLHPASKAKAKGTQKLRSCDVVSNHRLVTWRVVNSKPGLKFYGFSVFGILDRDDVSMDGGEVYDECGLDHHDSVEVEISS
ncbi:HHIP-like protein [Actinidia chinensis var. chinensis]|uniref:HHIP-like protein n=1 Tax=Actinidia chinensis var. chinensis TaxID=1590841 RepID=A0A2R6P988_ACTCC|nr:HHIP-like protein [Actinidia chinensis var. chinensis]